MPNNSVKYGIIITNYKELSKEETILKSEYKTKKYALILKIMLKDYTERIIKIIYSDSLKTLENKIKPLKSWYNYPKGIAKELQGNIYEI